MPPYNPYATSASYSTGRTGGYNQANAGTQGLNAALLQSGQSLLGNGPGYNLGLPAPNGMPTMGNGYAPSLGFGGYTAPQMTAYGAAPGTTQATPSQGGTSALLAQLMAMFGGAQPASGSTPAPGSYTGGVGGSPYRFTPTDAQKAQGQTNPRPTDLPGFQWTAAGGGRPGTGNPGGYNLRPILPASYSPSIQELGNGTASKKYKRVQYTNPLTGETLFYDPLDRASYPQQRA